MSLHFLLLDVGGVVVVDHYDDDNHVGDYDDIGVGNGDGVVDIVYLDVVVVVLGFGDCGCSGGACCQVTHYYTLRD